MEKKGKKPARSQEAQTGELTVVGVGASAGGLEALQDFFKPMPIDTGISFIVIQHLSPDYRSLMNELLARHTRIPIQIIEDGMTIEPDHIYLIPPRRNVSIFHDNLFLEDNTKKKGLNLPIDVFFRSLAKEKVNKAIGIILSGTGSDGTLGTRSIKEAGGMIMVQDEQSAKFDGMPRSSIATGLVDYILPPARMAEELVNFLKHPFFGKNKTIETVIPKNLDTLTKITMILRDHCGIDFSYYKENTVIRRLERRVSINRFQTLEEYLVLLSESNKEKDILHRELLIGVTSFFRDNEAFQSLESNVFPLMIKKEQKTIRIWSVACSTGEEVYSIAMSLSEYMVKTGIQCEIKIFATDIDKHSLEIASQGFYPDSVVADIDPALLSKYFIRRENGFQVNESIRKMIVFASHNLLKDPPFSKIDLLICRNLFIYLKPEKQAQILSTFYYSLNRDSILFLGSSETVGEMSEAFAIIDPKWKIYRTRSDYRPSIPREISPLHNLSSQDSAMGFRSTVIPGVRMETLLTEALDVSLPPSIMLDPSDNIVHIVGNVNQVIRLQPGRFSRNIYSILPQEMATIVAVILRRLRSGEMAETRETISGIHGFGSKRIEVRGRIIQNERGGFPLLSFEVNRSRKRQVAEIDMTGFDRHTSDRIDSLERELQSAKENLQATIEELETSNEELQSSNEELIASNEELQSTNEELQSVNEELYTVNTEYQSKIDELTRLNNDLDNLLKNTEVGALYLDRHLCIRKITPNVSRITNILTSDIGRPIAHISVMKSYEGLLEDITTVTETLQSIDKETTGDLGKTYLTRIRPYRTEHNAVEGIMITFIDITQLKMARGDMERAAKRLNSALQVGCMAWWEWDITTGQVLYDDRKATMIGYTVAEFPRDVYEICSLIHPDDYKMAMSAMRDHLEGKVPFYDTTYRIKRKDGKYAWYYDRGGISERSSEGNPTKVIGTVIDVTKIKTLEITTSRLKTDLNQPESTLPDKPEEGNRDNSTHVNTQGIEEFKQATTAGD